MADLGLPRLQKGFALDASALIFSRLVALFQWLNCISWQNRAKMEI
jgi:hypothetical protein